jgi:glucose-1-phosphatase
MSTNTRINFIVFDLGGVIVRICRSVVEAGERAGIAIDPHELHPDRRAARKAVHARYERGLITCDEFFSQISATTDGVVSPQQFRTLHDVWIIDEYPGVRALISDLHQAGASTGVLSNTNAAHWRQLVGDDAHPDRPIAPKFPAARMPMHRHASHLLGLAKPDPAIYAAFIAASNADPARTVFFDDLPENVRAAQVAGWHAHQIDHTGDPAGQIRSWLVSAGAL